MVKNTLSKKGMSMLFENSERVIRAVCGAEPMREGEEPSYIAVGKHPYDKTRAEVARIEEVHENLGTYGIQWFVAYAEDGTMLARMNAMYVSEVIYFQEGDKNET